METNLKSTTQKSYYGKAKVITTQNSPIIQLKSYTTIVLEYDPTTQQLTKLWNGYSRTTANHIADFVRQYTTLNVTPNKKWWTSLSTPQPTKQYRIIGRNMFAQYEHKLDQIFDDEDCAWEFADTLNERNQFWSYSVEEI